MRSYDPLGGGSSAGPFTATFVAASNLSVGAGVIVIVFSLAHLTASARFRVRAPGPVSGRLSKTTAWRRRPSCLGFPSRFRHRHSLLGHPVPAGELALLAVGLPDETFRPDPDGVPVFRTRELRSGWVPSLPRGRRCSSRPSSLLDRRLPLFGGQSLHPAPTSHRTGLRLTRHQRGFKQFTRPTVPLACGRPDGTGRPWAFPRASHPADQEPTTHAEVGTGHRSTDLELLAQHLHLVDPPIGSSLTTCDLASHGYLQQSRLTSILGRGRRGGVAAGGARFLVLFWGFGDRCRAGPQWIYLNYGLVHAELFMTAR